MLEQPSILNPPSLTAPFGALLKRVFIQPR
jgi:hypothetical protein